MAVGGGNRSRSRSRKSFSRLQRILVGLNVLVMIIVAGAILGGVWYLASLPQFRSRWDLTKEQAYTLSPRTKSILGALEKEVEVILVFESGGRFDPYGRAEAELDVAAYSLDLLKEYEIHSGGMVRVEDLDRMRDNLRVKEVFDELGVSQVNIVIVKCGDSRKVLIPDDLAEIDRGRVNPGTGVVKRAEVLSYKAEAALTAAVIEVTDERKPVACVLSGRGEAQIASTNTEGLAISVTSLENTNFEVRELNLAVEKYVPEDCDVLIMAGPLDDYSGDELAEIKRYLQSGGSAFVSVDPFSSKSLNREILPAFGVSVDQSTLTLREIPDALGGQDRQAKMFLVVEEMSRDSRITRPLAENDYKLVFFRAGALAPTPGLENITVEWLARTPAEVWGDVLPSGGGVGDFTFDALTEKKEPRLLGIACQGIGPYEGARLVLFAETYFYTNDGVQRSRGNLLLFTNSVNWLAAREVQLDIGPKYPYESRVELFPGEYNRIGFYIMVIIPAAAALLGVVVWWFRRR